MLILLVNEFTQYIQFFVIFITMIYLWFQQDKSGAMFPFRGRVMLTVCSIVLAHSAIHVFGDLWVHATPPRFLGEQYSPIQGWEAFYMQWYNTPSAIATWLAFAIGIFTVSRLSGLILMCIALLLSWTYLVAGLAYFSDVIYAMVIGVLCAAALQLMHHHFSRVIEGVQQLCFHIPQIMYPAMLLLMIDIANDLHFMTALFHFMFGYPGAA